MDYRAVRQALQALRFERRMDVPELAEAAGINKTTLYRLEEFDADPDRAVDLGTLEKLTNALDLTLSEFFLRIEGLNAPVVLGTDPSSTITQEPPDAVARTPVRRPLDDHNAVIAGNSRALVRLAETIDGLATELRLAREQAAGTGAREPRSATGTGK